LRDHFTNLYSVEVRAGHIMPTTGSDKYHS